MYKLVWDKGEAVDKLMQKLTVGNDYLIDKEMIIWDCIGSAAHARMLSTIGILSKEETTSLIKELKKIYALGEKGEIDIPMELEDVHNLIENLLVEKLGDVGLRIHAGRSRNDQILVTTRLYLRYQLVQFLLQLIDFIDLCFKKYEEFKDVQMPGYTHMQPAMPSSVGMWLHAFIEAGLEQLKEGLMLIELINVNPLGASGGFGSNISLNRELTTELLGFGKVQRSPIDCNNSRGRHEQKVLRFAEGVASMFEKLACDVMLYTTQEYAFFKLPVELTTGSSIFPQKRNSDIAELLRGRTAKIRSSSAELAWITSKLTSSYNRDFQYTKEPVIRAVSELNEMFQMAYLIVERFQVNEERLKEAMHSYSELYATYEANKLAQSGTPYRTAYKTVAAKVKQGNYDASGLESEFAYVAGQTDKYVKEAKKEFADFEKQAKKFEADFKAVEAKAFEVSGL